MRRFFDLLDGKRFLNLLQPFFVCLVIYLAESFLVWCIDDSATDQSDGRRAVHNKPNLLKLFISETSFKQLI